MQLRNKIKETKLNRKRSYFEWKRFVAYRQKDLSNFHNFYHRFWYMADQLSRISMTLKLEHFTLSVHPKIQRQMNRLFEEGRIRNRTHCMLHGVTFTKRVIAKLNRGEIVAGR